MHLTDVYRLFIKRAKTDKLLPIRRGNVTTHDSVNRFLNREMYSGRDLYDEASPTLNLKGGTLSVDDSVLDKPYSQYMALVSYFWSGKHHRSVKGINLVTLYYTDI